MQDCFASADNQTSTQLIFEQCVIPNCGCFQAAFPDSYPVSLSTVSQSAKPFGDFLIAAQNEKLLAEISAQAPTDNSRCDIECGVGCLQDNWVQFSAKEVCLRERCECAVSLYYRENACDAQCGKNCIVLPFERAQKCLR